MGRGASNRGSEISRGEEGRPTTWLQASIHPHEPHLVVIVKITDEWHTLFAGLFKW